MKDRLLIFKTVSITSLKAHYKMHESITCACWLLKLPVTVTGIQIFIACSILPQISHFLGEKKIYSKLIVQCFCSSNFPFCKGFSLQCNPILLQNSVKKHIESSVTLSSGKWWWKLNYMSFCWSPWKPRTSEGLWDPTVGHNGLDFSLSHDLSLHSVILLAV